MAERSIEIGHVNERTHRQADNTEVERLRRLHDGHHLLPTAKHGRARQSSTLWCQKGAERWEAVTLERQSGGSWQPQNPCRLMSATHLITFGSGSLTTVSLRPQSAGPTLEWAVGTYHVAVTYSVSRTTGSGTSVLSPSFTIG